MGSFNVNGDGASGGGLSSVDTSVSMIEAVLSGSEERLHEAYVKFCKRYFGTVRHWCTLHFRDNRDLADEAASELMLKVYRKLRMYSPQKGKTFRVWLRVVTDNECKDLRRRAQNYRKRFRALDGNADTLEAADNFIFELLIDSERRLLIQKLLIQAREKIPPREKSILDGYLAEKKPREIAALNEITVGAVRVAMFRLRDRLADLINQLLLEHPGLDVEDLMNSN